MNKSILHHLPDSLEFEIKSELLKKISLSFLLKTFEKVPFGGSDMKDQRLCDFGKEKLRRGNEPKIDISGAKPTKLYFHNCREELKARKKIFERKK